MPRYPHTAAPDISGVSPDRGHDNYYGVIVQIPLDPEVQRFIAENYRNHDPVVNGKAEIGMVYMQFYAGREYVLCCSGPRPPVDLYCKRMLELADVVIA